MAAHRTQRSASHGKIGDCEQSSSLLTFFAPSFIRDLELHDLFTGLFKDNNNPEKPHKEEGSAFQSENRKPASRVVTRIAPLVVVGRDASLTRPGRIGLTNPMSKANDSPS